MTDAAKIADAYIELWNTRDAARRRDLLAKGWTSDARYIDPLMQGEGYDGIDALIAGVQAKFPEFSFVLIGKPDGHGDHVRFSWGLGPKGADAPIKGTDIVDIRGGKIARVTGFLDQVPQAA